MGALPSGTVTLVLGDVESSTERWEASAGDMAAAMKSLNATIDQLVAAHDGARPVEQGEGDSFVAAFRRAGDAVGFATALQSASPLPVRVGIHTGDSEVVDGGYAGATIIRAARIRDAGNGGQVLLSQTTAALVADVVDVEDLGEHHLKGLTRPERIWQLPGDFPPLRLEDDAPRAPARLTAFIGRQLELAQVRDLLKEPGGVTITGAGGAGKTRLALELLDAEHSWFVDLAPIDNEDAVGFAIAARLGVQVASGRSPADAIAAVLRDKDALLVFDNCEHLLPACSQLATDLLSRCRRLTILATSREPLGLDGEVTYRLPSLAEAEAVELFIERARRADPRFNPDAATTATIVEICQRLDGMPLAIELAAARMRVFTATQLLDALHDRFRLLTGGARTAMPRQRTLEASVEWSYTLLLEPEQVLLRRLSIFAGGFTTEAAVAVAAGGDLGAHHVLDLLTQLVEKSLVTPDDRVLGRFQMLETIRHFAAARLVDNDDIDALRRRHFEFFRDRALVSIGAETGRTETDFVAWAGGEHPNLTRALQWAADQPGYQELYELCTALFGFWSVTKYTRDGMHWRAVLDRKTRDAPAAIRARVLSQLSRDSDEAALAVESIALARTVGDDRLLLQCILDSHRGFAVMDERAALLDEAIALADRVDHGSALAFAYAFRGFHAMRDENDRVLGDEMLARSVLLATQHGHTVLAAVAEAWAALTELVFGDMSRGEGLARCDRAAAALRSVGEIQVLTNVLALTAPARALLGDQAGADRDLAELDELYHQVEAGIAISSSHIGHGTVKMMRGDWAGALGQLDLFAGLEGRSGLVAFVQAFLAIGNACLGRFEEAEAILQRLGPNGPDFAGVVLSASAITHALVALERNEVERAWQLTYDAVSGDNGLAAAFRAPVAALLARVTARLGKHAEAVRLAASIVPATQVPVWDAMLGDMESQCRTALGDARFEELWRESAALKPEEAIALMTRGRGSRQRPMLGWDSLTPTESQVAGLVARGLPNKEVAAQLYMSEATVKTHLTRIYAKVGVRTRAELAHKYDV
jgi:predicted ATPase/DNA-binding CsgD family transcriptional regulator